MYNPNSTKAEEFISNEEILSVLEDANKNKLIPNNDNAKNLLFM